MSASRVLSFLIFCSLFFPLHAQFTDDFSDGDFTSNPAWTGDAGNFRITPYGNNQLQTQGGGANTLHLVTANTSVNNTQWEFWVHLEFPPSAGNRFRVYLTSDQSNLEGSLNGYYLEVGRSLADSLFFYRQSGNTRTKVGTGAKVCFDSSNDSVRVRVNRDNAGNWTVESDCSGGTNFTPEGTFFDNTHTTSSFFGVWCDFSSTRDTNFWFDDFAVTAVPVVDTTRPTLVSATPLSNTQLDVLFSEPLDLATSQTASNYVVNTGIGAAATAVRDPGNPALVHLTFSNPFVSAQPYILTVNNVQDQATGPNTILPNSTTNFTWFLIVTAGYKDVIINEIMADPDVATCSPNAEYIELYNRTANTINLQGWVISESTTPLPNYALPGNSYVVLTDDNDTAAFSGAAYDVIAITTMALTNAGETITLEDDNGTLIDAVTYNSTTNWYDPAGPTGDGHSLELINPLDSCSLLGNWTTSTDSCGGTPGAQNSVYNPVQDVTAPVLTGVTVTSPTEIQLCFDETLDSAIAVIPGNYTMLSGGTNPTQIVFGGPAENCVNLTFPLPGLQVGVLDSVEITGVADCKGNVTGTQYAEVLLPAVAAAFEVRINEIYPDETSPDSIPPAGFRTAEYIELFNTTNKFFNLRNWTIDIDGSPEVLDNLILGPQEYVILCDAADAAQFDTLGTVLPVVGMSTLTNAGDPLTLFNDQGTIIDSVYYREEWYQNTRKDEGGWRLELKNPYETCKLWYHWIASNDSTGGTPGRENSVFDPSLDSTPPTLISVTTFNPDTLVLCFDETLDPVSATDLNNYQVTNFGAPSSATLLGPGNYCVQLVFGGAFTPGVAYEVVAQGVEDCGGTAAGTQSLPFGVGANADPYEIVLNEIFPDPNPPLDQGLPTEQFIEIYNRGTRVIDLTDWTLVDDGGNVGRFPDDPTTLGPGEYAILTSTSNVDVYQSYSNNRIPIISFPTPRISNDEFFLYDADGELIDWMFYTDDCYGDPEKADGGWTLERVDVSFECANCDNWRASVDPFGGTPGAVNSVAGPFNDTDPPEVLSAKATDSTTVHVVFSEPLDAVQAENVANYSISPAVTINLALLNTTGNREVDLLLGDPLTPNVLYTLTVTNVEDCPLNAITGNNTAQFGIPLAADTGDIVLNELLFNPLTGGADYMELYNQSDKILDLSTIHLGEVYFQDDVLTAGDSIYNANAAAPECVLFFPGTYVCLTKDKQFQLETYNPIDPDAILEIADFPSYDDDDGIAVVFVPDYPTAGDTLILDRFAYLDDYQFPNLDDDNGVSLERLSFSQETQNPDNWHSAASTVNYGTPGYQNSELLDPDPGNGSVTVNPETFSPDQDGFEDVLSINYDFDEAGMNARVTIFDPHGRRIRRLRENFLLSTEPGNLTWDGIDDFGKKADIGVYVILFEVSNPNTGETQVFKVGCVLAAKL